MTMFNQPADTGATTDGAYFRPANHENSLILFETVISGGTEHDELAGADREFRIVRYVDLDGDCTAREAKVTATVLVRRLAVGATNILGRIVKAKATKGFAWVLQPHTPEDAATAKAWLDAGRPTKVDPFAAGEAEAANVTPEMIAQLRRLGMLKSDEPGF